MALPDFSNLSDAEITDFVRKNQRFTKEFVEVLQRWKTNSKGDLFDAVLQKEKDLESWKITPGLSFPKEWEDPPLLIPPAMSAFSTATEVINDILKKSWETQAGRNPNLPDFFGRMETLSHQSCFTIHGFLKYYLDCFGKYITVSGLPRYMDNIGKN